MWQKVVNRAKRHLKALRFLAPHRFVSSFEAEEFGWYQLGTRELLTGFPIGPQDTLADVGCGEGGSSHFAALCDAEVYALDIDPAAIAAVKRRIRGLTPVRPFHTVISDSNPLPLPDGVATRVVCQEVMEHVDDPQCFIRELVRIGRPGALYLLTVPDPVSESLQRFVAPDVCWRKPNHLRVFGREEFGQLVTDAGLTIQTRALYSFFWSMWWTLFWAGDGNFKFGAPGTPVLKYWNKTWAALMANPRGAHVRKALNDFMPKSQIIIARKAA
jgi:SAM-dependent methyltransferase